MAPLAFRREQKKCEDAFETFGPQFTALIGRAISFRVDWASVETTFGSATVSNPVEPTVPSLCSVSALLMIHKMALPGVLSIVKEVVKDSLGKEAFAASFDVIGFNFVKGPKEQTATVSRKGRELTFTVTTAADNAHGAGNSATFSCSVLAKAIEALLEAEPEPAAAPAAAAAATSTPGGETATGAAAAPLAYKRAQTEVEQAVAEAKKYLAKRFGDKVPAIVIDFQGILSAFSGTVAGSEVLRSVSAVKLVPQYLLQQSDCSGLTGALFEATKDALGLEAFVETFDTVYISVVPAAKEQKVTVSKEGKVLKVVCGTPADNSYAAGNSGTCQATVVAKAIEALL